MSIKSVKEILDKTLEDLLKGKRTGPNSERAEAIVYLLTFMGEDREQAGETEEETKKRIYARIKYWLGRTRKYTPGEIRGLIKQAKEGRNPPALFNWILKKNNEKK